MKTMMKLGVILAAVLLVATMLVTGCTPEPSGYTDGIGSVRLSLNIDNPNARATFLPGTTIDTFQQFRVQFVPTVGGAAVTEFWDNRPGPGQKRSGEVPLVAGTYTLTVIAYTDYSADPVNTPPTQPVAISVTAGIDVSTTSQTLAVTLRAYDPKDILPTRGNGLFAWDITNDITAIVASATMTITEVGGSVFGTPTNLLTPAWSNLTGIPIPEGYYYVDFAITAGDPPLTPNVTRNFRHVLHIYEGHTSTATYTFTNDVLGLVSLSVVITSITYAPPVATPPAVQTSVDDDPDPVLTSIPAGGEVTITLGSDDITLLLSNATSYASIVWWFNGTSETANTWLVDTTAAPFNVTPGRYPLTVTGTTPTVAGNPYSGAPFSTEIFIIFVP